MPQYQAYPTVKTTRNRKLRKGVRIKIFMENKAAGKKLRLARKAARDARLEAVEVVEGTEE